MQRCRSLAHDASGRRYCDGNNCRGAKRAGHIMHTVRIDDAAPGYIVRKSVIIHIGPAIAATAGIARSVNIPRGSRTASSAWHVDILRLYIDALVFQRR